jgi:hypothetical protein
MSTYIQEVLSTRDSNEEILTLEGLPNGFWHLQSCKGHYIISPDGSLYLSDHLQLDSSVSWIDETSASPVATREGLILVNWRDFIAFLHGEMNDVLEEYTGQILTPTWSDFINLRALQLCYYSPQGPLVLPIEAECAEPWSRLDYTQAMPEPDANCVAFLGHQVLGWPLVFLRKLYEFGNK